MFLDKQIPKGVNMKKLITASLVAAVALSSANATSLSDKLAKLEAEIATLKKQVKRQNKKINTVKAHDSGDNIKWSADLRTAIDNINYDMANDSSRGKNDLMSTRLWLNMAYAPDSHNVFKGQLAFNKAFGADLGNNSGRPRGFGMDTFDWITNEALTGDTLKVRQAYWLYLGEKAFGMDMPWTFSVGRRPSTNGFLANLRDDDPAQSPLGHIINVEFDGLSSKLDLSNVTGVPGMSFKVCMGQGSTNAAPIFSRFDSTSYSNEGEQLEDVKLAGFIFEPYNDGQFIVKTTAFRAFSLPGYSSTEFGAAMGAAQQLGGPIPDTILRGTYSYDTGGNPQGYIPAMSTVGDMDGAAISILIDGLTDDGYFADAKVFGSLAWSKTRPDTRLDAGGQPNTMLGSTDSETGSSYWLGVQLPVTEKGKFGLEYNHGSKYWRSFTYGEDTMIGSKLAARGDAIEAYFTYQLTDALSAQLRYTKIDYDYTGSNGFFGRGGTPMKISDVKKGAAMGDPQAQAMLPFIVESAQDARFYLRYRF